ncbi:MAG: FG-GAP repeat protein, partial [Gemmatimonadota bacterium]
MDNMRTAVVIAATVCLLVCLGVTGTRAGVTLLQTFTESNVTGMTNFGYSVSGASDVNGDSYDDVIVGSPGYNGGTGRAYVYFGAATMDNIADVTLDGEGTGNSFGFSVSGAGDVNNDGYDDVIVGADRYNSWTGRAYVYFGAASMDNIADVTCTGEGTDNYFGFSVSGAGDVNNDGYDDVIVGAFGYNSTTGRAYVYLGAASMDNTADVTLDGEGTVNHFGISVSGAGDVNNDGYDDVIVGAGGHNSATGRTYVYLGAASMDNTADVT